MAVKHKEIYLNHVYPDWGPDDKIPCEICGNVAVDIHHIIRRGLIGPKANVIENLMAVCRKCHTEYGDKTDWLDFLFLVHFKFMDVKECSTPYSAFYLNYQEDDILIKIKDTIFPNIKSTLNF